MSGTGQKSELLELVRERVVAWGRLCKHQRWPQSGWSGLVDEAFCQYSNFDIVHLFRSAIQSLSW